MRTWIHAVGYCVVAVAGSSGEFFFGIWDRILPLNKPPIAHISVVPKEGVAPLKVTAHASESSDPEGRRLKYRWRIGDEPHPSETDNFQHTFKQVGAHVITVEVEDHKGLTDDARETITTLESFNEKDYINTRIQIDSWIGRGEYRKALRMIDELRHTCKYRFIPERKCAQLHSKAAETQLFLDRVRDGFDSMIKAVKMMPDDVVHILDLSQFQILNSRPEEAISELSRFRDNRTEIGSEGLLNLGIAHAMMGSFDEASAELKGIRTGGGRFGPAAEFAEIVVVMLQTGSPDSTINSEMESDVNHAVCRDSSLRSLFPEGSIVKERHIFTLRMLVGELAAERQGKIAEIVGSSTCQ